MLLPVVITCDLQRSSYSPHNFDALLPIVHLPAQSSVSSCSPHCHVSRQRYKPRSYWLRSVSNLTKTRSSQRASLVVSSNYPWAYLSSELAKQRHTVEPWSTCRNCNRGDVVRYGMQSRGGSQQRKMRDLGTATRKGG